MMRMLSLVSLMVLAAIIFELSVPARGDEVPAPPSQGASSDVKLTPEMQAMIAQWMKMLTSEQGNQAEAGKAGPEAQPTGQAGQQAQAAQTIQQFLKTLNNGPAAPAAPAAQGGQGGQAGNSEVNQLLPLVFQMLKTLDNSPSDDPKPASDTAASSDAPSGDQKPHQTGGSHDAGLHSTGLVTHSLGNAPRMSSEQWRALFRSPAGK